MQQNPAFGHRQSRAPAAAAAEAGSSPSRLPIRIETQIGAKPGPMFGGLALVLGLNLLPLLLAPGKMAEMLLHGSTGVVDLGMTLLVVAIYLLGRNRGELEIDDHGVRIASRQGRWFYDWADIERVAEAPSGVKLLLKGRSDDQNAYNLIPSRFGLTPTQLYSAITEGVERYGGGRPSPSGRTVSPADDLRRARMRTVRQVLVFFGAIFGGLFAALVVWQALECLKALDLQKHGRATEASVVRIYTAGCGRSGCNLNVEYSFTPEPAPGTAAKAYRGYKYIASDDHRDDPDLVYAKTNGTVPIVYDTNNPAVSDLNFNNRVFAKNPILLMLMIVGVLAGSEGVVLALILAGLTPTLLKALKTPRATPAG